MKTKPAIKNQKGASVVEFAIVLPLLISMFIGICEFGLLWYNKQVVINASREGARAGISRLADTTDPSPTGLPLIADIVNDYCANRLVTFGGSGPVAAYNGNNMTMDFGDDFLVVVAYQYNFLVAGLFHLNLPTTFVGQTMMKMEMDLSS